MSVTINRVQKKIQEALSNDYRIDEQEMNEIEDYFKEGIQVEDNSADTITWNELKVSLSNSITATTAQPLNPSEASVEQLKVLMERIETLTKEAETLKSALEAVKDGTTAEDTKNRQLLQAKLSTTQAALKTFLNQATTLAKKFDQTALLKDEMFEAAGMDIPEELHAQQKSLRPQTRAMANGRGGANTAQNARGQNASRALSLPQLQSPGVRAQGTGDGENFPSDAFLRAGALDDIALNNFDQISQNQRRGQELLRLFHKLAKQAMTGELEYMFEFFKVVNYIVSKSRGKSLVDMGTRLIQIENQNKENLAILQNTKIDPNDPNAAFEMTKAQSKYTQDSKSLELSQKMIAQNMEDMAIVVETMNNTLKGILEAKGRVLRNMSRFG
ncbi:MAG: hypothetical protein COX62_06345 [Deltaproteobacteria bacterium CG_4_10_14_0_2_um_filter_43_8]|nr:MAG: hypothetical protein COV43_05425 [Deltaproteobacteria bacterium CG11_big_fil_rev_8_21_14_0_20_42_23]PJA19592.1 MAG: hypothetical protein COX62_06345 [Deltaproteobacteria bacterium CG_4_10_14_0_2_um_filter_43_8]PJC64033.1 MAG: hypothetical protein CO021_06400 [Deltaproteobacteria bacterium CG_4_9_14_0_2_um_filter_42_21]